MKIFIFIYVLFFSVNVFAANDDLHFDFQSVSLKELTQLYYNEVNKTNYSFCDDFLKSDQIVSFRSSKKGFLHNFQTLLGAHGFSIENNDGFDLICKTQEHPTQFIDTVYRVKNTNSVELLKTIQPLFRSQDEKKHEAPMLNATDGFIAFSGPPDQAKRFIRLCNSLDRDFGQVQITAAVLEVQKLESNQSALQLFTSLFKGRIELNVGGLASDNSIKFKLFDIEAILSSLQSDSRFIIVSRPFANAKHNKKVNFTTGLSVPVLTAVQTETTGRQSQSVDYRDSGVILQLLPRIFEDKIETEIFHQISAFSSSSTGLNDAPTLTKKEINTTLDFEDGQTVVLAGASSLRKSNIKNGFLGFQFADSNSSDRSELLILINVKRLGKELKKQYVGL